MKINEILKEQGVTETSFADQIMAAAKAAGLNARVAGTPEQERARTQQMLAQRAKERQEREQQAALADIEKLPELKTKYEEMKKLYRSLGGSNWQYADREQNLSDAERKARSMEPELNRLAAQIHRAEQSQGVAEGGNVFAPGIENSPAYKAGFATGKLPVPHPEGTQEYAAYYKGVIDRSTPTLNKGVAEEVDTGEYDARKTIPSSKEKNDEVFRKHRERMKALDKDEQGVAEGGDVPHWRVEQSKATGRYYVVSGYSDKSRKVWKSKLGAIDFVKKADAEAKAQELNQGVAEGNAGT